jgi:hypothetical protein
VSAWQNFPLDEATIFPQKQMSETPPDYDPFIANRVYPDAEAIFTRKTQSLTEVKDTAVVILDTNSLLVPYMVGKEGLDKIRDTYTDLRSIQHESTAVCTLIVSDRAKYHKPYEGIAKSER